MSSLLLQQEEEKLELAVQSEKTGGKWTATISGKVSAENGTVLDVTITGRREHLQKTEILPVAWANPIRRKTRVTGGAIKVRQEFDRAGVYTVEIGKLSATIRVGSAEVSLTEAAAQVKKTEDLLDLADKALEKFEKAASQKDRAKTVVKPMEEIRDVEAKLSEFAGSAYPAASVDEGIAALHEAILFGSWIMNTEGKPGEGGGSADADGAGADSTKAKDVSRISVPDLRSRVQAARKLVPRETALWAAGEYVAALRAVPTHPKEMDSFAKGLKSAREKLGSDFAKEIDPSKITPDTLAEITKAAEAYEASLRK